MGHTLAWARSSSAVVRRAPTRTSTRWRIRPMALCKRCGASAGFGETVCRKCWAASLASTGPKLASGSPRSDNVPRPLPEEASRTIEHLDEPVRAECPFCAGEILSTARKCKHCGEWLSNHREQTATVTSASSAGLRGFGIILLVVGLCGLVWALNLDASVATEYGTRINNIGLLNDKQNYLIASGVAALIGLLLVLAGRERR